MSKPFRFALVSVLMLFAVPSLAAEAGDEAALRQVSRDWAKAAATGNVDAMVSFWSDDAVVLPPGKPAIRGKAAIRAYVEESLKIPGFTITWEPESASVAPGGAMGYLIERNRVTFTDENGVLITVPGKAVTVWRKDGDGKWKCVADIWNDEPATPGAK